jgi:hypothetical protein
VTAPAAPTEGTPPSAAAPPATARVETSDGAASSGARSGPSRLRARAVRLAPVLTAADVGALLGLQSIRAARELIVREGIPHVRLGKRLLVLRRSLLGWLAARERVDDRAARVRSAADRIRSVGRVASVPRRHG